MAKDTTQKPVTFKDPIEYVLKPDPLEKGIKAAELCNLNDDKDMTLIPAHATITDLAEILLKKRKNDSMHIFITTKEMIE